MRCSVVVLLIVLACTFACALEEQKKAGPSDLLPGLAAHLYLDPDPLKLYWTCPDLHIPRQLVPASHFSHREADLNDYVPSQGLSTEDAKALDGGKAAPKVEKGNLLESKTKR